MTLTVPSYIIRGTYAENVEYISTLSAVQGVELLFFLFDEETKELFGKEKTEIESYCGRLDFSVHMPDILKARDKELIRCTQSIASRYIFHPPAEDVENFIDLVSSFKEECGRQFLLENVNQRPFENLLNSLEHLGICCDTGHILLEGGNPRQFIERWGERVGEIHLHGVEDGWDHRGFDPGEDWFEEILPFIEDFHGALHLEVFNKEEILRLIHTLEYYGLLGENKIKEVSL